MLFRSKKKDTTDRLSGRNSGREETLSKKPWSIERRAGDGAHRQRVGADGDLHGRVQYKDEDEEH